MDEFQLWYVYFDSIFLKNLFQPTKLMLDSFSYQVLVSLEWPNCKQAKIGQCFRNLEEFIKNKQNWQTKHVHNQLQKRIQLQINNILIMLLIEKKYAYEYWKKSNRRVQASICHLFIFIQQFALALIPNQKLSLLDCQDYLCTKLFYIQNLINSLILNFDSLQKFMFGNEFYEERILTKLFFHQFGQLFKQLHQIKGYHLHLIPKLLEYVNIINPIQISKRDKIQQSFLNLNRPKVKTVATISDLRKNSQTDIQCNISLNLFGHNYYEIKSKSTGITCLSSIPLPLRPWCIKWFQAAIDQILNQQNSKNHLQASDNSNKLGHSSCFKGQTTWFVQKKGKIHKLYGKKQQSLKNIQKVQSGKSQKASVWRKIQGYTSVQKLKNQIYCSKNQGLEMSGSADLCLKIQGLQKKVYQLDFYLTYPKPKNKSKSSQAKIQNKLNINQYFTQYKIPIKFRFPSHNKNSCNIENQRIQQILQFSLRTQQHRFKKMSLIQSEINKSSRRNTQKSLRRKTERVINRKCIRKLVQQDNENQRETSNSKGKILLKKKSNKSSQLKPITQQKHFINLKLGNSQGNWNKIRENIKQQFVLKQIKHLISIN